MEAIEVKSRKASTQPLFAQQISNYFSQNTTSFSVSQKEIFFHAVRKCI
jgi:hypothetical protein